MDEDYAEGTPSAIPETLSEDKYLEISSNQKTILDLDAIFNLDQSKLHKSHSFEKPKCPNKRIPSKHPIHLHEMEKILADERAHEKTENFKPGSSKVGEFKPDESGYRYLKIGGMRVLPVPVSGPMFWPEKNK